MKSLMRSSSIKLSKLIHSPPKRSSICNEDMARGDTDLNRNEMRIEKLKLNEDGLTRHCHHRPS
uniref:IP17327p n=1 Tax=Drosophila melanogaster TaxID=7227 RepID=A1A6Z9_DROME|nr:IP17327p [Drosophila melanogaster]